MPLRSATSDITASILLVDDNANGLTVRKAVLAELGHQVVTATRGAQALELFAGQTFDLVVTDYKMPKMDGMELIGHLRELSPRLPIILVSGFVEALGLTEASTGADAVIQKNAHEVGNLTRAVNRLLRRKMRKPPASGGSSRTKRKSSGQ